MGHQQKPKIIIDITWWIGFSLMNISSVGHLIDYTRKEAFVCVLLPDTFYLITLWRVLSKISSVFLWSVSFINHIYLLLAVLLTSVTENCPTFNQRWRQKSHPAFSCLTSFCCEIMCVGIIDVIYCNSVTKERKLTYVFSKSCIRVQSGWTWINDVIM